MIVLLVSRDFHWVFGQLTNALPRYNKQIEFLYAHADLAAKEPEEFLNLVRQADIVHFVTNLAHISGDSINEALKLRPSVAGLYHATCDEEYKILAVKKATLIHVMSSEWKEYLTNNSNVSHDKIWQIPFGVDTRFFYTNTLNTYSKSTGVEFRLGSFANANSVRTGFDRKGIDTLLELTRLLERDEGKYVLCITGQNWKNVLNVKSRGIEHHGFVSRQQLRNLYHGLDAYLITSRIEGGPVTLMEAMATGVPVISTNVGMSRDLILHGQNGFLVTESVPEEFYELIAFLRRHSNVAATVARYARETIESYDWSRIAPIYGEMYHKLSATPSLTSRIPNTVCFRGREMNFKEQRESIVAENNLKWAKELLGKWEIRQAYNQIWQDEVLRRTPLPLMYLVARHIRMMTYKLSHRFSLER